MQVITPNGLRLLSGYKILTARNEYYNLIILFYIPIFIFKYTGIGVFMQI